MISKKYNRYYDLDIEDKVDFYLNELLTPFIEKEDEESISNLIPEIRELFITDLKSYEFSRGRSHSKSSVSLQNFQSQLGHLTNNWNIPWAWIVHHIRLDFTSIGRAFSLRDMVVLNKKKYINDKEILLYKSYHNEIRKVSDKFYAKKSGEPIVFSLHQLLKGGFQLSPKKHKIRPTLGATYFGIAGDMLIWDTFSLFSYDRKQQWNKEKNSFEYIYPELKKTGDIRYADKIIIGDKVQYIFNDDLIAKRHKNNSSDSKKD